MPYIINYNIQITRIQLILPLLSHTIMEDDLYIEYLKISLDHDS